MGCSESINVVEENEKKIVLPLIEERLERGIAPEIRNLEKSESEEKEEEKELKEMERKRREEIQKQVDELKNDPNRNNTLLNQFYKRLENQNDEENTVIENSNKLVLSNSIQRVKNDMATKGSKNKLKYKFKGITILQTLEEYFPKGIELSSIKNYVFSAFCGNIVNNKEDYIPGKNVTREQADAIAKYVYLIVQGDKNCDQFLDSNDCDVLKDLNVKIGLSDVNEELIKKIFYKDEQPSDLQIKNTERNITQGFDNVKILTIEF